MKMILMGLFSFVCVAVGQYYDDIESVMGREMMMKVVRATVNQTEADTLNLPANATSIRENITDNFSCEGLPYGYYADVDNECQIFHVCLPSQSSSGRNITYRWSFICPEETVFNQVVLVCTRQRDSIDCTDSPMYYDWNLDIGKINNDTAEQSDSDKNTIDKDVEQMRRPDNGQSVRAKPKRKQNVVAKQLRNFMSKSENREIKVLGDSRKNTELEDLNREVVEDEGIDRIESAERRVKLNKLKRYKRRGFRFSADV